jgi:pectin methylesterase-like acyl-CoA thioesterase
MMERSTQKSVALSPAEIQLLDALIKLQEEAKSDDVQRVTVFDPPDALGIWVKAGKWLWKHRKKVVTLVTAATDFVGADDFQLRAATESNRLGGGASVDAGADDDDEDEATLEDLLAAREAVLKAVDQARHASDDS